MSASPQMSPQLRQLLARRTPLASPATEQAQRVLRWLEQRVVPGLNEEFRRTYQRARRVRGRPGQAYVRGFGIRVDVRGTGDDAYGHHRLRAVVREVVIPLVEEGALESGMVHDLQQGLRGEFSDLYREVERAMARQQHNGGM